MPTPPLRVAAATTAVVLARTRQHHQAIRLLVTHAVPIAIESEDVRPDHADGADILGSVTTAAQAVDVGGGRNTWVV